MTRQQIELTKTKTENFKAKINTKAQDIVSWFNNDIIYRQQEFSSSGVHCDEARHCIAFVTVMATVNFNLFWT